MFNRFLARLQLRRLAAVFAVSICAVSLTGCDMQMFAFQPFQNSAQKQRIVSIQSPATPRRAAVEPCEYRLGSGDRLGEASFAIYRKETRMADAQR